LLSKLEHDDDHPVWPEDEFGEADYHDDENRISDENDDTRRATIKEVKV
jgi:hypothetical protein